MPLSSCSSCLTELETASFYRCTSCSTEQRELSNAKLLCEDCIIPHLRKKHLTIDSKGNEPLACSVHSFIFSEFCKTCDVLFCLKCSAIHRKHDCKSIDEKASEVREKVFDLLTDLELKEKPIRLKITANSAIVQKNKTDAQEISLIVQNQCRNLEQTLLRDIEEKSKLNEVQGVFFSEVCDKTIQFQKSVRELLSESNPNLIQKYACIFDKAEDFKIMYEKSAKMNEVTVSFCSEEMANQCFKKFGENFRQTLSHQIGKQQFFVSGNYQGKVFRICNSYNVGIEISKLNTNMEDEKHEFTKHFQTTIGLNITITHVYPLFCYFQSRIKTFIILLSDKTALIFENASFSSIEYPESNFFLWPYKSCSTLYWSYWDPKNASVRLTHKEDFSVKFVSCPKIKMSGPLAAQLFFVDEVENKIVEFSTETGSSVQIPSQIHQVESIGCVTVISKNLVCVWSIDAELVHLISRVDSKEPYCLTRRISTWKFYRNIIKLSECDQTATECDVTFFPASIREKHLPKDHYYALWIKSQNDDSKRTLTETNIECSECGKVCKNEKGLADHKSTKHEKK